MDAKTRIAVGFGIVLALGASGARAGQPMPYTEEAVARGVDYFTAQGGMWGRGVALVDLDGDLDPDLVAVGRMDGVVGVFENIGQGQFVDRSAATNLPNLPQASGVIAGDYDADGDLDLFISNWLAPDLLARNEGGFQFTDVTAPAGIVGDGAGTGCAWGDFDLDTRIDLYVANRTVGPAPVNRLFRNLGVLGFVDMAPELGVNDSRLTFQAVFFDMDRDGDSDLYLATDKGYASGLGNRLFENTGSGLVDISAGSGADVAVNAMGIAVGDFDGDGRQDLYVTNTSEGNPLLMNQGAGSFLEQSALAGVESNRVGWGASFFDYDNDGRTDLYVCNMDGPNRLYTHEGVWPCSDVAPLVAAADPGISFCLAVADVDGDGDLDHIVQNEQGRLRLYINHEGERRHWIKFRVVGIGLNTSGIGTVVEVQAGGRTQIREVRAGGNYKSQNETLLHFGLDAAQSIDQVNIMWPGGSTRTIQNLSADQLYPLFHSERLGDSDGDGDIDERDVETFVDVLLGIDHDVNHVAVNDFNGDGAVDARDIGPFVCQMILGPGYC